MTTSRRELISQLFHTAVKLPPDERIAFLQRASEGDRALQEEIESLLRYESGAARFLETPAADVVTNSLAELTSIVGRQVGPYQIVALLGSGGMAEVYRARDLKLGRDVAIKILPAQFMADHERRARFIREARILATLSHPHIGAIYGVEEFDGGAALVLELVEGPTLADCLVHGALPLLEALTIGRQIADALDAAHAKGIVHRDLKPPNIVIQKITSFAAEALRVRVLDFGLGKLTSRIFQAEPANHTSVSIATADGRLLGTPAYMSPEQARGHAVDKRADIWAFGCILFEMLAGRRAFEGDTVADTFARILEHPPDWTALLVDTPELIRRLLERCLQKDQRNRLHDIADALREIDDAMMGGRAGAVEAVAVPARVVRSGFARPVLPTEAINPLSVALDNAPVSEILEMMANEDRRVVAAVHQERERIAQGVEIITQALRTNGRLIFVGAGTSGRLGALEAAEMPPTFGTSPHVVRAVVPGGQEEVFRYKAQSEAEDRYEDGVRSIARLRVLKTDVVVGISASGTTPFVRGALTRTRKTGAKMILVTCWAGSDLQTFVDVMIAPAVGPEIIAGSTRLKAGTATKMVLNMLTTASMVRLGKTYGNLMIDVQTRSDKLKDRARRIFIIVTGLDYDQADDLLRRAHWNVKAAIVMQKLSLSYVDALDRLKNSQGSIREATGEDIEPRLRELVRIDRVSP